jgi:vesicle transport through interaction with t-SNAREs 1
MTSSSFDRYHEEFTLLIQQQTMIPNDETILQQCNDFIKQMSLEARSAGDDPDQKQHMLDRLKECKAQYAQAVQQSERQSLLAGTNSGGGGGTATATMSSSLQTNEDTMAIQNECLERAHQSLQETEQVALEITGELGKNRETMSRTQGRIQEVSTLTGLANSILNRLKK